MSKRKQKNWTGWHWLRESRTLGYDDGRAVVVGKWMEGNAPPRMCNSGMHASVRALDALEYAPGPIICRVELSDDVQTDGNKSVASKRKVLWMADATRTLREFSIWCAEEAIKTAEKLDGLTEGDRKALEASKKCNATHRLFLDGKATKEDLAAARDAAWAAARDAAWDASWAASWAAARDAAWAAARDAAWAAARDAAWDAQNAKLEEMLVALAPKHGSKRKAV